MDWTALQINLTQDYFGNPLQNYLIAAAVFLAVFLVAFFIVLFFFVVFSGSVAAAVGGAFRLELRSTVRPPCSFSRRNGSCGTEFGCCRRRVQSGSTLNGGSVATDETRQ